MECTLGTFGNSIFPNNDAVVRNPQPEKSRWDSVVEVEGQIQ
jgi:hypothetical protein